MTDACKTAGCVQRLCAQKEEYEERLRVQKEECDERLRVKKEEHEKALTLVRDAVVESFFPGYYPLPLDRFPLEIIALIADFVHDFVDLARMSLTCRSLHNGVLLSRQWIVVEEIVAASKGNVESQRLLLRDRGKCALYACGKGLPRALRALNLSRSEVTDFPLVETTCANGQLEVLKYLHTTYALTVEELDIKKFSEYSPSIMGCVVELGDVELVRYLHDAGVSVARNSLNAACCGGDLEMLTYLHTEVGFTAEDVRFLVMGPLYHAARARSCDCLAYLRTGFGITPDDARRSQYGTMRMVKEVFELT